jgi:sec-independent protein translocase protein TatC
MNFISEFTHIRKASVRILVVFAGLFFLFFAVSFNGYRLAGFSLPALPGGTVSGWAIGKIQTGLFPAGTSLVSLSPLDPFFAKSSIAAALAFLIVLPLLAYEFWAFISPALYKRERRGLLWFFVATLALLAGGGLFSWAVLLPLIMQGLYSLNPVGVLPLYGLRAAVSLVTGVTLATSLMFLLPVVMMALSRIGLVPASFWRSYARHALFISVVLSAIITPDGSGMSMILLAIPIGVLYGLGYLGSVLWGRGNSLLTDSIK